MPGYSRTYPLGSSCSPCCGPSKDTTCLSDHCLPWLFAILESLRYYKLSVNASCRRISSERHHVHEGSSPLVLLKWIRRGREEELSASPRDGP
ncbi:hypothetical protein B0H65DRAFT_61559 [Neurospora tetraspora]|uniref:Uncharacterized protein n=1 Tax=Neurospora tetraspora TaxID=94610 RepID=A0AAE0MWU3_9PEZI|nr:hypothetical protein B0H65DRAFT_61559 [Neurospora tetraspora]